MKTHLGQLHRGTKLDVNVKEMNQRRFEGSENPRTG